MIEEYKRFTDNKRVVIDSRFKADLTLCVPAGVEPTFNDGDPTSGALYVQAGSVATNRRFWAYIENEWIPFARLDEITEGVDISGKVDKLEGYSLISDAEIIRLGGISNKFDGTFISLAALQAAYPASLEGHEALVDPGAGTAAVKYIWDM